MTVTRSILLAGVFLIPNLFASAGAHPGLEEAPGSEQMGEVVEGTRNLSYLLEREKLRLAGDDLRAWHRLIVEAGAKGAMFNPNLDQVKLAKGVSFGKEPDVQVFAAYPASLPGEVHVLIYAATCDFIARLNERRNACGDAAYTAYVVTDDGVPFSAHAGPKGPPVDVNAPAVLEAFKVLRAKLLAAARKLPAP